MSITGTTTSVAPKQRMSLAVLRDRVWQNSDAAGTINGMLDDIMQHLDGPTPRADSDEAADKASGILHEINAGFSFAEQHHKHAMSKLRRLSNLLGAPIAEEADEPSVGYV